MGNAKLHSVPVDERYLGIPLWVWIGIIWPAWLFVAIWAGGLTEQGIFLALLPGILLAIRDH